MNMKYQNIAKVLLLFLILPSEISFAKKIKKDLMRPRRQKYKKEGLPSLFNCAVKEEVARQAPLPLNFELTVAPRWTDLKEYMADPGILKKYTWEYTMTKEIDENGKPINISINLDKFSSKPHDALVFPSYTLVPGLYKIVPNVTRKTWRDGLKPFVKRVCYLLVIGVPPIAVITGGSHRLVPIFIPIVLNGTDSIDLNRPDKDGSELKYYWTCNQTVKPPTFCNKKPISTRTTLVIPSKYITANDKFEVVLKVTSKYHDTGEALQVIDITKNGILLEIRCEKNCPPMSDWSNVNSVTFLAVKCLKNCEYVKEENYFWEITKKLGGNFDFDYTKHSQFGRNGEKFVIREKSLSPDDYLVSVNITDEKNRKGEATMTLFFTPPPKVDACVIIPPSGEAVKTPFSLQCNQGASFQRHLYELFVMNQGEDISTGQLIVSDFHPGILKRLFLLPTSPGRKFTVKVSIENGPFNLIPVRPQVKPLLAGKPVDEVIKGLKEIYEGTTPDKSLSAMMTSTDPELRDVGLQNFQALVNELYDVKSDDKEFKEFVEKFKYQAVDDLLKVQFDSVRDILKAGDSITRLLTYNEANKSDPLLTKFSSTFCKKVSQKHIETVRRERYPLASSELSHKVARVLSSCLEANTNANFDIIEPLSMNITTEEPVLLEPMISEDYADYHDFGDDYYKNMENLLEATNNIFEGSAGLAKAMALTAAVGEEPSKQTGKTSETVVAKDKANILARMKIESNGVALVPSQDFAKSDHPIDILMTTWTKDIFWWNPNHTKVATNIVHIEFWHSTCRERIRDFEKPADVYLNTKRGLTLVIVEDVLQVPEGFTNKFHQNLSRHIYIRRVALPRRRTLIVTFHNLSTILNVAATSFKFPTIEDFAPPKLIGKDNHNIRLRNKFDYDIWAYIGVLPSKKAIRENPIKSYKLKLSFVATCCIRWKATKTAWQPACMPGDKSDATVVHCRCNNFSTIAGHVQNIKSIVQEVIQEDFVMELQVNLIIFITVAATICLYCLFLLFKFFKRKKKAMLYFLADNLISHRYAYLVVVVTGKQATTSHVTLQIKGDDDSTPPHVLNFPDPKRRILQKNSKDVFTVTNRTHLGEILEISLWIDCSGTKPSWYCKEVELYDLQLRKLSYFNVKRLFSPEKGIVSVTLQPSQRATKTVKKISLWDGFHTWCFWAQELGFSYVKRLTVVLSSLLLMGMIILMMQRVPEMEMRDCFDLSGYIFGWYCILQAFVGSLVSFLIHISIAWIFRFSEFQVSEVKNPNKFSYSLTKGCWKVLIVLIVISSTFLLVRGFWVPLNQSFLWLTACGIGLLLKVFLYENIFIIIMGLIRKYETEDFVEDKFDAIVALIHKQRFLLLQHFGGALLTPFLKHLHKPVPKTLMKERKLKNEIRLRYSEELTDLIMFTIYILILYVVILVNKSKLAVINKNEIVSMLQGEHTRTVPFTAVRTVKELYQYINQTLIPVMQPQIWYEGLTISEPGMMSDFVNKFIGVARFRQQRITPETCETTQDVKFLNITECLPEFAFSKAETRIFGYNWGNFSSTLVFDRLRTIWQFFTQVETGTLAVVGKVAAYSGGGYVAYLGRNLHNSYVNFRKIVVKLWIDQQTRSFFVEFLTYNANYNMFNAVRLLFEQSASGYISHTIEIYPARMIFVHGEMAKVSIIFFGLFVLWVLVLLFKRSVKIYKNLSTFFKNFWLVVDVIIISLSLACIIVYAIRFRMVGKYLDDLEKVKHNEFISYFSLFYTEDFLSVCAAFLVLISTARLWKFLRFGLFFRIMERTLSSATVPLLALNLAYTVVLLAFGMSGLLIFGSEFVDLSTLFKVISSLVLLALKPDEFPITDFTYHKFAYFYFGLYLYFMQVVLFIYVTIICMAYVKAQLDFSAETVPYNLQNFVQEQIEAVTKYFQQKYERMKGGEAKKFVKPKSDEFRYANCVSTELGTLVAIAYVFKSLVRNSKKKKKSSAYDFELMLEVCRRVALGVRDEDDTEVFFKGRFVGERVRIVDEKRIIKMAEIVELLLQPQVAGELKKDKKKDSKTECIKVMRKSQKTMKRCSLKLKLIYSKLKDVDFDDYDFFD